MPKGRGSRKETPLWLATVRESYHNQEHCSRRGQQGEEVALVQEEKLREGDLGVEFGARGLASLVEGLTL